MCAYFLTQTIRSLFQFEDDFVEGWHEEIFHRKPSSIESARSELVQEYARMFISEHKYRYHLDYWIRKDQEKLLSKVEAFFAVKS